MAVNIIFNKGRRIIMLNLSILLFSVFGTSCFFDSGKNSISGNREYKTVTRSVDPFHEIEVRGDFNVLLKTDADFEVVVDADANLHNYIYTEVKDDKLVVSQPDNARLKTLRSIDVEIHYQKLDNLVLVGNTRLESDETLSFDSIEMSFIGASKARLDINGNYISGVFPGSSNIEFSGTANTAKLSFPGATQLDASGLKVNDFDLSLAGAGKANIFVVKTLSVNIAGAGLVNYRGNPETVRSNIGGIGQLRNQDE